MSHYFRPLLVTLLIIALTLPVGAQEARPLGVANQSAPDAPTPLSGPAWYDGPIQYSSVTNCFSIIQGFPYQENGAGTYVGFLADPNAGQPAPNTTYYVHVVIAGMGNSCSGMRAYLDVALPSNTSLAIDATNRVFCFFDGVAISPASDCPQSLPPSTYNPGAYTIPSTDGVHANLWPVPQGRILEFQIPVRSTTPLSNSTLQANVWMFDGNSSPWLRPTEGVYVFSVSGGIPTIRYVNPSTTNATATSARSEAVLSTSAAGTGYFDLGTTLAYGLIHEAVAIPGAGTWLAWDQWGPDPALTPDTLYHWRFTFTPSGGGTVLGADQTFRTLPDGRLTVGNGTPASCTAAAVNSALATAKEILFDCGALPVAITLSSAHSIATNLTINGGNKVTLRRQNDGLGNLFNVQAPAHLTLTQITLSDSINSTDCGGAINVASGAQLTLNDTRFINNRSDNDGGAVCNWGTADISATVFKDNASSYGHGGAIGNYGSLSVTNSKFMGNTAAANGGGIDMGGIVTVTYSTFISNTAGWRGGGINTYGGTLTVVGSSFTSNTAGIWGGALANDTSTTTVTGSTFSDNSTPNVGGGLETSGPGSLTLTNSTVSANHATADGGGLYWYPAAGTGPITILNSTIANNVAGTEGGNIYAGGATNAGIHLKNTLVASGSPNNCDNHIASQGNNLENINTCGFTAAGDIINANPNLGPLLDQDGDGAPATHALPFGSPAIDTGTNSGCPATDERGTSRPKDGDGNGSAVCDIGAFESPFPSPTINNINPSGGPAAGGQSVTITGTNLSGASVTIGGIAATVTGTTATTATFTAPAHAVGAVDVTVTASFGTATWTGGYTYFPLSTPASFSATATSASQVALSWSAVSGATSYEVWRSSLHSTYNLTLSLTGTSTTDTGLNADTTYLYKVRAMGGAGSAFTAIDPATTTVFTNASLSGVSIQAVHVTELRTAVNAMRAAAGLLAAVFTDPTLTAGSTTIKRVHVTELRTALDAARAALGLVVIAYTDSTIAAQSTMIRPAHITELRARTQ